MGIKELNDILKNKDVPHIVFLYGAEDYLRSFYSNAMADILVPDRDDFANRVVLSESVTLETVKDACDAMPFFSEYKVVLVRDSGLLKARATSSDNWDFLNDLDPSVHLIISEGETDARSKAFKLLGKLALCCELGEQDEATREKWLAKRFRSEGVAADQDVIKRMVELCDASLYTLANEADKLTAYAGRGGRITSEDVEVLCTASVRSVIFDLVDAMSTGRSGDAYRVMSNLKMMGEADQKVFVHLAKHINKLLRYKLMQGKGCTDTEINAAMKQHPYAFRKMSAQSRNFSLKTLKKMQEFCVEADEKAKGGYMDTGRAIELLIAMAESRNK